ncbi:MAG TPA: AMP-binding protein, partial [Thermoanaerobaculia bacterium]|nr:AMP-binding protein [Thermoanaerobaculia bacterium]
QEGRAGRFSGTVGYLVNPVALRADVTGEPTAGDLVDRARRATLDAFTHREFPFALLAERLQPERGAGGPPLLQAMIVLHRSPAPGLQALASFALGLGGARLRLGELELESLPLENPGAQLDLTLQAAELDGSLAVSLSFNSDLFDPATAERLLGHLDNLARSMAAAPSRPVWDLDLLSATERRQLAAWNATAVAREGDAAVLHELFERQAARTPGAPAVVAGEGVVTYEELNRRANQLAHRLRRLGVGPEERVGVLLDRTPDLLAGLLGVLKAGGAYVPLDPAYPRERLELMASDAGVRVLVTVDALASLAGLAEADGLQRVRLDGEREALAREDGANPAPLAVAQNLAYVIYTSGSTGRPKGVAIEHRSPVELVRWARGAFTDEELAGVLAATSVCFDLSVFELFVPLACGGRVILAGNVLALPALAAAGEVSLLNTVPSAMAELAAVDLPPGVVTVNLAGEPLPWRLVERLRRHRQVRRIQNLYGPTEDTTYSTGESIGPEETRVTIGRPLDNTRGHVLDQRFRPVPVGVAGEICLA